MLRDYDVQRILFSYNDGSYLIFADSLEFGAILPNEFVDIAYLSNDKVQLKKGVELLGQFDKISLIETSPSSSITLTSKSPVVKERKYQSDFEISGGAKGLTIVNLADMNNYLSGVVESEGGGGKEPEYYKVQAIMCRTYVLKNLTRHKDEGFAVCDRTHCQAYHSMLRFTPKIREAVVQTDDLVLLDDFSDLAGTYFHANCGGQTSEAAYVWNSDLPYLKTFKDTFCIYTKQATWEKRIPQQKWADFLVNKYNYPLYDSVYGPMLFTFNQADRMAFYHSPSLGIPLRDIRQEFQLKSTYFSCYPEGLEVVIRGKGVGHGVGLCQEGAMKMAKYGFTYQQISLYYFPGLKLASYKEYLFFRQKQVKIEEF
ncbi:MAG: SpoIID/LytB domain protein [Crocinitomicaceae bacterium]|nr:SpoIID/LytB domain protein [Crocinitomicaceae bacterium]